MSNDIMVSVYCLTYNHERYVRDALESFVNQKTNFRYEVLVHDDASTDHTAQIIREYAAKYPDVIRPILQTENQYSKQVDIGPTFVRPCVRGKYIASCEGDDYWCDDNKLQKQVDFLEAHPEYAACVHDTKILDCRTGEMNHGMYGGETDRDLTFKEIVNYSGACFHTSSVMARREFFWTPEALQMHEFGDYPRAVYLRLEGKVRYLKDAMSVYRKFSEGSWTVRNQCDMTREKRIRGQKARTEFTSKMYRYCVEHSVPEEYRKAAKEVADRDFLQLMVMQKGSICLLTSYLKRFMGLSNEKKLHVLNTVWDNWTMVKNGKK